MNGKKAKDIRRKSRNLLLSLGIDLAEGKDEYNQAINCKSAEAVVIDNKILRDPDGMPMMKPTLVGGTVHSLWKWKLFYKWLKKIYKDKNVDTDTVLADTATMMRKQWHADQKEALRKAEESRK